MSFFPLFFHIESHSSSRDADISVPYDHPKLEEPTLNLPIYHGHPLKSLALLPPSYKSSHATAAPLDTQFRNIPSTKDLLLTSVRQDGSLLLVPPRYQAKGGRQADPCRASPGTLRGVLQGSCLHHPKWKRWCSQLLGREIYS